MIIADLINPLSIGLLMAAFVVLFAMCCACLTPESYYRGDW